MRFEATFAMTEGGGHFAGTILDDGPLGEADVTGTQAGFQVDFTKLYRHPPRRVGYRTGPIRYKGTISENGMTMTGEWTLAIRTNGITRSHLHGVWEAHRLWLAEAEAQTDEIEAVASLALSGRS
jgi:hypothetical protein